MPVIKHCNCTFSSVCRQSVIRRLCTTLQVTRLCVIWSAFRNIDSFLASTLQTQILEQSSLICDSDSESECSMGPEKFYLANVLKSILLTLSNYSNFFIFGNFDTNYRKKSLPFFKVMYFFNLQDSLT